MADPGQCTGLVLGKFMPLHNGHLELVRFAKARCERLIVLVCTQTWEPLPPELRLQWVQECFEDQPTIDVRHSTTELPYRGLPSREVSWIWGEYLSTQFPEVDVVFTSEDYGDQLAEVMGVSHILFDRERNRVPVSATDIRRDPFRHWALIPPEVRSHFVRKVCLFGPESVGKSTLAAQLAHRFGTVHVPEMARDIIPDSSRCHFEDLRMVAEAHAREIRRCLPSANKLLFCDTDLLTTRVYSSFLFGRELNVEPWVEDANRFDLHLFCEADIPYVQDGTRLGVETQPALREAFWSAIQGSGMLFEVVRGGWTERLNNAVKAVEQSLL